MSDRDYQRLLRQAKLTGDPEDILAAAHAATRSGLPEAGKLHRLYILKTKGRKLTRFDKFLSWEDLFNLLKGRSILRTNYIFEEWASATAADQSEVYYPPYEELFDIYDEAIARMAVSDVTMSKAEEQMDAGLREGMRQFVTDAVEKIEEALEFAFEDGLSRPSRKVTAVLSTTFDDMGCKFRLSKWFKVAQEEAVRCMGYFSYDDPPMSTITGEDIILAGIYWGECVGDRLRFYLTWEGSYPTVEEVEDYIKETLL